MDVPETVRSALDDRPIDGRYCLEAGAGRGNTAVGLLDAGAETVIAVTNDHEHARSTRERVGADHPRLRTLTADLRSVPLPDDTVGIVTAHALCNVVPTADIDRIAAELTRVAAPGAHLIVDDYAPLPDDASVRALFAVENAAAELADGRSALTFYPATVLRSVFECHGWTFDRHTTLLDPVPWTESHIAAHVDATRKWATRIDGVLGDDLAAKAERLADDIGSAYAGRMYSLGFQLPDTDCSQSVPYRPPADRTPPSGLL